MTERRYSEREIREVFERAARDQEKANTSAAQEGLTLDEMQEIAASAGIAPEFVAHAAQAVALGEPETGRVSLGPVPRGVFRTEFLPSPPSEALWNELVADLRRTFSSQGTVTETARLREWRNGNLCVALEPSGDGSRLHLQTYRDTAAPLTLTAAFLGLIASLLSTTNAAPNPEVMIMGLVLLLGGTLGAVTIGARQRSWATTRERQMEAIAQRTRALSLESTPTPSASHVGSPQINPTLLDAEAPDAEVDTSGTRIRA